MSLREMHEQQKQSSPREQLQELNRQSRTELEEIFRYYFLRQPQRVIGVHIGRTRSTAGRHIRLALQRLRRLMEGNDYE